MNRILTILLALAVVAPLSADQSKKAQEKDAQAGQQPAAAVATTQPAVAVAPRAQPDSPLVAAAKRANRLGKRPGAVITNESVKTSKGHVSTSTVNRSINVPEPTLGPEAKLAKEKAEQSAASQRDRNEALAKEKAAAGEKARAAETAAAREDGNDRGRDDAETYFGETGSETKPPQF